MQLPLPLPVVHPAAVHCGTFVYCLLQDQQQFSLYNPLDLFSGEPPRMKHALWQLLHVPSVSTGRPKGSVWACGSAHVLRSSGGLCIGMCFLLPVLPPC